MTWRTRVAHLVAAVCAPAVPALLATSTVIRAQPPAYPSAASRFGGSVAIRETESPDCLDPQKTVSGASFGIFNEIVDTLMTRDNKGNLQPDLATKWTFSHGGKWVTFFLRHGVKFSNGDPFTASAVKYTFDRAVKPSTKSPGSGGQLAPVRKTVVVNRLEVRLILKAPYRPLLSNLSVSFLGILDPKATQQDGGKSCQNPIGTGAYKVKSVGPGFSTVTLVRNPYHTWESPWLHNHGAAYLQQLVFTPIISDSTATSELLTGEVDISAIPGTQLIRVQGDSSIKLHKNFELAASVLNFNESHPPFNKPAVRRAVAEVIDRKALIKVALNGLAVPVYAPIGLHVPFYPKTAQASAARYHLADARRIIAANHATGPYTLVTFNDPFVVTAVELIQAELAQVGMNVKVETKPVADYIATCGKGQCDIDLNFWGWPDADIMYIFLSSTEAKSSGSNFSYLPKASQARIDTLLNEGRTSVQSAKAAKAYGELVKYINQNAILVPIWDPIAVTAARARVKGWHTDFEGIIQYPDLYVT
ncbi:MAG: ABC transporter substrate-binding protein [Chloroflexota bacterium]|nr:ABC transporter substrate-binding protein [Chloroflexota bacterium]